MSLSMLQALRRQHQKPAGVVSIVFTDKPLMVEDSAAMVVIRSTDSPELMDLRPLVGLCVALYGNDPDENQFLRLLTVLENLNCRFFGAVTKRFVLPMMKDATPRHAELLTLEWMDLCQ